MTPRLPLLLAISVASLLAAPALAQQGGEQRVAFAAGYSVPLAGYHWGSSEPWSSEVHFQGLYERSATGRLAVGVVGAYDVQRSGRLGVRALGASLRGSYAVVEEGGFALAPYLDVGATALSYVSDVEHIRGSSRVAPRVAAGAVLRQRVWREASLTAALDYQIVADRFDGFQWVGTPPAPRGPETTPPPSFRFTGARLGLSWSF